ncbi:MAG TPA: hypothetical protein ENM97_01190 [Moorella mulderi]|nr:hypothetical protein [Moorella mulderi]
MAGWAEFLFKINPVTVILDVLTGGKGDVLELGFFFSHSHLPLSPWGFYTIFYLALALLLLWLAARQLHPRQK